MEKTIISLMTIAEDELKGAKILYSKGIYHKALFLFQQANEKAYKASALITGQIQLADLKYVGHDFFRLLKKAAETMNIETKEKVVALVKKPYNLNEEVSTEDIFNEVDNAKRGDFFNLDEEEIRYYIKNINKFRRASKSMLDKNALLELTEMSNKISLKDKEGFVEYLNSNDADVGLLNIQNTISNFNVFYIIGIMTSPHSEQSRYPFGTGKNLMCPTQIYTKDFPLVKHQRRLMNLCNASIIDVKKIL